MPAWHVSVWVQALLSSHAVPSGLAGFEQKPVAISQLPIMWHWSVTPQTTRFEPVQAPAWQVSVWVQGLLSSHAVPSVLTGLEHFPVIGSHVPAVWHWSLGLHTTGVPA